MKAIELIKGMRFLMLSFFLLCLSGVGVAGEIATLPYALPPSRILPQSEAIRFEQVSFDLAAGRVVGSDWGQFRVLPDRLKEETGICTGYLNVFFFPESRIGGAEWMVQNLYVRDRLADACETLVRTPAPREIPVCSYIDLRPGVEGDGAVNRVLASVVLTRQPLPDLPEIRRRVGRISPNWFKVEQMVENAEGDEGEEGIVDLTDDVEIIVEPLMLVGPPPAPIVPGPPSDIAYPDGIFQVRFPSINAAVNQCVPAAHANVLEYLEDRYNAIPMVWRLAHSPVRGIGKVFAAGDVLFWEPVPPHSLLANIDAFTRRLNVKDLETGNATSRCRQIRGILGYVAAFGGLAETKFRHQGGLELYGEDDGECDNGTVLLGGLTTEREGLHPTYEWIRMQLQKGRGIVMSFGRYNIIGERTSGHMVRVWGASSFDGKRYLWTVDDSDQGDNFVGYRSQQWEVADTGQPGLAGIPDGRLNMNGMSWEIEFAMSAEAKFSLVIP